MDLRTILHKNNPLHALGAASPHRSVLEMGAMIGYNIA